MTKMAQDQSVALCLLVQWLPFPFVLFGLMEDKIDRVVVSLRLIVS